MLEAGQKSFPIKDGMRSLTLDRIDFHPLLLIGERLGLHDRSLRCRMRLPYDRKREQDRIKRTRIGELTSFLAT